MKSMGKPKSYNGYRNYETWNVALYIQNDEGIYSAAKLCKKYGYRTLIQKLISDMSLESETPDGVSWHDPKLDIKALDEMISAL